MRTKFFASLLACCTLTVAVASDQKTVTTSFKDFQGQYELVDGRLLTITQRGRRQIMQLDNQPEVEIVAVGSAAFEAKFGEVGLEFVQYPNGNVPAVRVIDNSGKSEATCQLNAPDLSNHSCVMRKNVSSLKPSASVSK